MRTKVIAGNWKMNKLNADASKFIGELATRVEDAKCKIVVCVPFTSIVGAVLAAKGTNIEIGAQNVHWADNGAYTGEVSANMLVEAGVKYVVIGHSERRQYFAESNETVCKRMTQALKYDLKPIVCIGESLAQRQADLTERVLAQQIEEGFKGITAEQLQNVIVAYEPIWAIGTGVTATNAQANETIGYCRQVFSNLYGKDVANQLIIQYGGSMNEKNAEELLAEEQIDGGLVGGASLDVEKFTAIISAAK